MERETQLNFRVSLEEKARIVANAKAAGIKVSDYVRSQALRNEDQKDPFIEAAKATAREATASGKYEVQVKAGTSTPESQPVSGDLSDGEITTLARKRWPHLPLVRAEAKVRAEL